MFPSDLTVFRREVYCGPSSCGPRERRLFNNNSLKNKTTLRRLSQWHFNNVLQIFSLMFVFSTAANTKLANLWHPFSPRHYNIAMLTTLPVSGVSCVLYTHGTIIYRTHCAFKCGCQSWNLQCVCGHLVLTKQVKLVNIHRFVSLC